MLTGATLALSALADPGASWGYALLRTGLAGALGGVVRMAARRSLAKEGLPAGE